MRKRKEKTGTKTQDGGKQRFYIVTVMLTLVVLAVGTMGFIVAELVRNSHQFLENFQRQQQLYVNLMSEELDRMYREGCNEEELCDYLEKKGAGAKQDLYYLVRDEKVLFARDRKSTEILGDYTDFETFREAYEVRDVLWSSAKFGDNQYEVGWIYSQAYLLKQTKMTRHFMQIIIPVTVSIVICFILAVSFVGAWVNAVSKNRELKEKMVEVISKVDNLQIEKEQLTQNLEMADSEKYRVYNRNVVLCLLKKSEDAEVLPLTVMIVKIVNQQEFIYGKFYSLISMIQGYLNRMQMIAETGRDEITVLMYRTSVMQAMQISRECSEAIGKVDSLKNLHIKTEIVSTEDSDGQSIFQHYEEAVKRIRQ